MKDSIDNFKIGVDATLRDAISCINEGGKQFAVVVSASNALIGVITDGDVRRALLKGINMDESVQLAMNGRPKYMDDASSLQVLRSEMLQLGLRHMPLVNSNGEITSCYFIDELGHNVKTNVPVILMAGGKGERLYPLTKDVPKPLLKIGTEPILGLILRNIAAQGFFNVQISINYLGDQIIKFAGDGSRFGLSITYLHESKPLGTAGALSMFNKNTNESIVVMNADLLTDVNLRDLIDFHSESNGDLTVVVREHTYQVPYGVVSVEGSIITEITEKPSHRHLVAAGIYVLKPKVISHLKKDEYLDMPNFITKLIDGENKVCAFPLHEDWIDIGRPADLARARQNFNDIEENG